MQAGFRAENLHLLAKYTFDRLHQGASARGVKQSGLADVPREMAFLDEIRKDN
jgi:hypothetical protein